MYFLRTGCFRFRIACRKAYFYGHPYYAWSAGYDTYTRENIVKDIFACKDENKLNKLLKETIYRITG
jgi:hypothetical protein